MPHYIDGTPAKVGDHVRGMLCNTKHEVAGTLVSISPGSEACNGQVAFIEARPMMPTEGVGGVGGIAAMPQMASRIADIRRNEDHGTKGSYFAHVLCYDYADLKNLTKISGGQ